MDFVKTALWFLEDEVISKYKYFSLKLKSKCSSLSQHFGGLEDMTWQSRVTGSGSKVPNQLRILFGLILSQTVTMAMIVWSFFTATIIWEMMNHVKIFIFLFVK